MFPSTCVLCIVSPLFHVVMPQDSVLGPMLYLIHAADFPMTKNVPVTTTELLPFYTGAIKASSNL